MTDVYDVIVVGGGPASSTTSWVVPVKPSPLIAARRHHRPHRGGTDGPDPARRPRLPQPV